MRYLADTDVLIDALSGIPSAVRTLEHLSSDGIAVSIVSYGELFEGAFGSPEPELVLNSHRQFLATFPLLPLTDTTMAVFARIRGELRRHGLLIPDFDLLIGATAIQHDLALVTGNQRHFARIQGLTLYQSS